MSVGKDAKDFLYKIQKNKDIKNALISSDDNMGRKNVLDLNIAVGVDISGSISSSQYRKFMAQLDAIKGLSRVKVLEVDTQIVSMYDYYISKNSRIVKLGGGGGTDFTSAFSQLTKMKPDAILFMTDGMVAGSPKDPNIPVGWVLTPNGKKPYSFGEVVVRL